jgi:hypothetical protein
VRIEPLQCTGAFTRHSGATCANPAIRRVLLHSEVLPDLPRKMLVNVRVSGDGLLLPGERVEVDVVPAIVDDTSVPVARGAVCARTHTSHGRLVATPLGTR